MNDTAIQEGDGYTITGSYSTPWYYNCAGVMYFGGAWITVLGSKITRIFTGLPAHTSIMINFTYVYGDYWYYGDYAYLLADGVNVWENLGYKYEYNYTTDCGIYTMEMYPGYYFITESVVNYSVSIPHSASSITLDWTASLYWYYESWFALRNVQIMIETPCNNANCSTCDPDDYTKCVTCKPDYYFLGTTCYSPCPLGYFASETNCSRNTYRFDL